MGFLVLVVDDNRADRLLLTEALQRAVPGIDVKVAKDGDAALAILSDATQQLPDLVLMDLNLPRRNGIEVLGDLRGGSPPASRVPVIIMTGSTLDRDVDAAYAAGANSYVVKARDLDSLFDSVAKMCAFWLSIAARPTHVA